ncbi:methyl-accepting chemotaxis protein [Mesobacillus jeotgali]|uniref:methyl-accepting chemotaxis protein n=1 Tax=Mesobacillus jeotgali TaxID=129985 RepID=UPI0011176746|nr:methyl-accepting chemotaxis protein [Mesobacillus jeotgali]
MDENHVIRYSYIGDSQFDRPALDEIFKTIQKVHNLSEDGEKKDDSGQAAVFVGAMKDTFQDIVLSTQTIQHSVNHNLSSINELENELIENKEALSLFFTVFEQMESKISMYSEAIYKVSEGSVAVIEDNRQASEHMKQTSELLKELVGLTKTIGSISSTISSISGQTKILALNASIEAARAGEHGKGFSVVAKEVGKLAEASADASKNISAQLEEIETKISTSFSSFIDFDGLMQQIDEKVKSQNQELNNISSGILSVRDESTTLADRLRKITEQEEAQQRKIGSVKQQELSISSEINGIHRDIEENNKLLQELDYRVK